MAKKLICLGLVVVLALGGWLAHYFSDKEVIKRQLTVLAVELSKEGKETPVQIGLKLGKVKKMLATSCRVTIADMDHVEDVERDLVIHYLIYYRQRYRAFTIALEDMAIDIPGKGAATVKTMVHLTRMKKAGGESRAEQHPVDLVMRKGEENWLIHAVIMPDALIK